jgi:hypothetical protein
LVFRQGLLAGAGQLLPVGGMLLVYGPFKHGGVATPESNAQFDETLKTRDPTWGLRDVETVKQLAAEAGFVEEETVVMPANNTMMVFRRQ